jgi:hypothetical protein
MESSIPEAANASRDAVQQPLQLSGTRRKLEEDLGELAFTLRSQLNGGR